MMTDSGITRSGQVVDPDIFLELRTLITDGDLPILAAKLGVKDGILQAIQANHVGRHEQIVITLLNKWKQMNGNRATTGALCNALTAADRDDLSVKVRTGRFSDETERKEDWPRDSTPRSTAAEPTSNVPCYRMSSKPRGKCLILTYDKFENAADDDRLGNDVDEKNLKEVFGEKILNFKVHPYRNLSFEETEEKIKDMSEKDHGSFDCFVLFVCSHGDEKTFKTSDNRKMAIQDVLKHFKAEDCKSLAGKPKIFFFNTCRGTAVQKMVKIRKDRAAKFSEDSGGLGSTTSYFCPNEADFCVVLSTVPGYVSYRDHTKGTYFVQSLCECLTSNYRKLDLIRILILTNESLIKVFEKNAEAEDGEDTRCQISTTMMTMSKLVSFANENV